MLMMGFSFNTQDIYVFFENQGLEYCLFSWLALSNDFFQFSLLYILYLSLVNFSKPLVLRSKLEGHQ